MVGNIQDTCSKLDQTQLPLNLYKFGINRLPLMESFWVGEERKWKRLYIIFMHCKSFASQGLWKTPVCNKPKSHAIKYSRMWLGANIGTLCASHSLFKKKLNNVAWKIINCSFFIIVVLFEWKYNLKGMYTRDLPPVFKQCCIFECSLTALWKKSFGAFLHYQWYSDFCLGLFPVSQSRSDTVYYFQKSSCTVHVYKPAGRQM